MPIKCEQHGRGHYSVEVPASLPAKLRTRGSADVAVMYALGQDLVEVATSVMLVDRLVSRPHGGTGSRQIRLTIPVRCPSAWRRSATLIQQVLSVVGDDIFSLHFERKAKRKERVLRHAATNDTPHVDRVVLFSGGLDSTCASAHFARAGHVCAYVTHYVSGINRIESLLRSVYESYSANVQPIHASFYISPSKSVTSQLREKSRRLRPFLFASLALATAMGIGAHEICVCENGPLALNLPMNLAMVPTRHANSLFLDLMGQLGRALTGAPIRFSNPFELSTKGQMCDILRARPHLALDSVSCWNQQWSGTKKNYGHGHCGYCIPCLVRRTALQAAGIEIPRRHFDLDILRLSAMIRLDRKKKRRLGPYRVLLGFANRLSECGSWRSFVREWPDVIEAEPTASQKIGDEWYKALFRMMKEFAKEVRNALER